LKPIKIAALGKPKGGTAEEESGHRRPVGGGKERSVAPRLVQ